MDLRMFSKEGLCELNIHELRKFGQEIGVRSPSSLNKADLVENIYAIITGIQLPYKQKDKRGRPAKATINDNLLNNIKSVNTFGSAQNSLGFVNVASQGNEIYVTDNIPKNLIRHGIFMKNKSAGKICKFPYVESEQDAYICNELILDYNLHDFDVVDFVLADANSYFKEVSNVISVNGKKVSEEEIYFNRLEKCGKMGSVAFTLKNKTYKLERGSRTLILDNVTFNNTSICDEYVKSLSQIPNTTVIRLCLDKQEISKINESNVITFSSLVVDNPIVSIDACNNATLQAKKEVFNGKDVILIIDNMESLIKIFATSYADNAQMYVKRILFTANSFNNETSITIIGLAPTRIKLENSLTKDYIEYFDNQID